eukprot:UN03651
MGSTAPKYWEYPGSSHNSPDWTRCELPCDSQGLAKYVKGILASFANTTITTISAPTGLTCSNKVCQDIYATAYRVLQTGQPEAIILQIFRPSRTKVKTQPQLTTTHHPPICRLELSVNTARAIVNRGLLLTYDFQVCPVSLKDWCEEYSTIAMNAALPTSLTAPAPSPTIIPHILHVLNQIMHYMK